MTMAPGIEANTTTGAAILAVPPTPQHTMIDPDDALRFVLDVAEPRQPQRVPLGDACGLRLAETIWTDQAYPPFDRAMMDGYAVVAADAGSTVEVSGEVAAGDAPGRRMERGSCVEIMTGAPCPPGTGAVVPKEETRRDGSRVVLPRTIRPGQHIAPEGSDCAARSVILETGEVVTPLAVAMLASLGRESVAAVPRVSLAVITTGVELVPIGQPLRPGQIRDSNGPMLAAMARGTGVATPVHLHADDRLDVIVRSLEGTAHRDIVLLSGGVSAGNYDLVPHALARYGAEIIFHKVTQKPGKPMLFSRKGTQLLFGLPGNPLACHQCFHRYVAAAIRRMNNQDPNPRPHYGQLIAPVRPRHDRTYFLLGRASWVIGASTGWCVEPLLANSSADVFTPSRANCYLRIEPRGPELPAGTLVSFVWTSNEPGQDGRAP